MVLDKIRCDDADFIKKTAENFEISETSVRRYIKDCLDKGIVTEDAERKTGLFLTTVSEQWNMVNAGMLEEDDLYWKHISPFLSELPGNVQEIWYYAFTTVERCVLTIPAGIRSGSKYGKMLCIQKFRLRIMV